MYFLFLFFFFPGATAFSPPLGCSLFRFGAAQVHTTPPSPPPSLPHLPSLQYKHIKSWRTMHLQQLCGFFSKLFLCTPLLENVNVFWVRGGVRARAEGWRKWRREIRAAGEVKMEGRRGEGEKTNYYPDNSHAMDFLPGLSRCSSLPSYPPHHPPFPSLPLLHPY